ncbi:hypothetical protein B5S31_g5767 [[Candida] boidinii]|nr:hypothetical protein B5S31_g5767 [[Candida] boidinii]
MVWDHLSVTKAHVAYACIGVFSSCFSLCSLFIKERLYIGEASVATIFGLIIGPHCLNWFNPFTWGNEASITLELSRIVLIIQIFAVAVELPKKYMKKHWLSVFLLLVPVMTVGWLMVGLFVWILIPGLKFSYALLISACVTATDPVLAAAVVGKGKFAKRVPGHLRNILSAESGCNDGMAFPFIYLSLNLIIHEGHAGEIVKDWLCVTILYECVFGCILGAIIGWVGRHAIKYAEGKDLIDRESFLAFYIVLSFVCAGFGSILGVDDLLVSFAAGTAFAWNGWFAQRTEESQVSTVIDLLLNLAYFVYFGSIIPWEQFNNAALGLNCWRLIILSVVIIFLRRIPAVLAIKPITPDIKTWKEAFFCGHFGPVGVGAVFAAILAIGELETVVTHEEGPLADYPVEPEYYQLIHIIWPIVTYVILTSIIIHGSSVTVMTLGKQLQTMTFTLTFTKTDTEGVGGWTNRLPKLEVSNTSFSLKRVDTSMTTITNTIADENNNVLDPERLKNAPEPLMSPNSTIDNENATKFIAAKSSGANNIRRRQQKLKRIKRKKHQKNKLNKKKNPPVSESLDLKKVSRDKEELSSYSNLPHHPQQPETFVIGGGNPTLDEYEAQQKQAYLESQLKEQNDLISKQKLLIIKQNEKLNALKLKYQEMDSDENSDSSAIDSDDASQDIDDIENLDDDVRSIQDHEAVNSHAMLSRTTSPIAGIDTRIQENSDTEVHPISGKVESVDLKKFGSEYRITEDILKPQIDEDGAVRIPTTGYADGSKLIIEDQDGEILHTVTSRASHANEDNSPISSDDNSLHSTFSHTSLNTLKGKLNDLSSDMGDAVKKVSTITSIIPASVRSKIEREKNLEANAKINDLIKNSNPKNKIKLGHKRRFGKITKKFHGYRADDHIIIENDDGEIIGRYLLNKHKNRHNKYGKNNSAVSLNSKDLHSQFADNHHYHHSQHAESEGKHKNGKDGDGSNIISNALNYMGFSNSSKQQQQQQQQSHNRDVEKSGESELIPQQQFKGSSKKEKSLERNLKKLINADPKKAHIVNPKSPRNSTYQKDDSDDYDTDETSDNYNYDNDSDENSSDDDSDNNEDSDIDEDDDDDYEKNSPTESNTEKKRRLAALGKSARELDDEEEDPKTA